MSKGETMALPEALRVPKLDFGAHDSAIDRLYVLPLHDVPLMTPGLRKASMIKNARVESVIELFRGPGSGSGQIDVDEVPGFFQRSSADLDIDMAMLRRLAMLESFDVFSLRIELRRLKVDFTGAESLNLTAEKRAQLTEYMQAFTRPLIQRIYGHHHEANDASELVDLVRKPNQEDAMRALKELADTLKIKVSEVPSFLEECGDVFLSLSYFKETLDQIATAMPLFFSWMQESRDNFQVRADPSNLKVMKEVEADLTDITTSLVGRFDMFTQRSNKLWEEIDPQAFERFREFVTSHHISLAAVLCGLSVKMKLWLERFPTRSGSPLRRIEFVKSEIVPGLRRIKDIETGRR